MGLKQWTVWGVMGVVTCVGGPAAAAQAAPSDRVMRDLAERRGCTQCHSVEARASALDDGLPVGPSWQEVAAKYQGQRGVERRLVQAVRQGSKPEQVHWRGQVAGKAMPPNAVRVTESEAKQLVRWILGL